MLTSQVKWLPICAGAAALAALAVWASVGGGDAPEPVRPPDPPPSGPLEIDVTAADYQWHLRYPGSDGQLGTDDDVEALRHLHLPVGRRAVLHLHSKDFVYTLAFPAFGLKEIAVPDLDFALELTPDEPGEFELRGDQFCGFSHPDLIGRLVVQQPAEFGAWLEARRNEP